MQRERDLSDLQGTIGDDDVLRRHLEVMGDGGEAKRENVATLDGLAWLDGTDCSIRSSVSNVDVAQALGVLQK